MEIDLLWIDVETSGLDATRHQLLEIAAQVTDSKLVPKTPIHEWLVYRFPNEITWEMPALQMHLRSGLVDELSKQVVNQLPTFRNFMLDAQSMDRELVMAGAGVHFDRYFLKHDPFSQVPDIDSLVNHRMLDVSSFEKALQCAYGYEPKNSDQWAIKYDLKLHRAVGDIQIAQARYLEALKFLDGLAK